MHGGQRPVMTGVHGLQHVQTLRSSHLAENDAIGTHTQSILDQFPLRHLAFAFDIRRAGFQTHHMVLAQLQFRRVLDRHDPFVIRNES